MPKRRQGNARTEKILFKAKGENINVTPERPSSAVLGQTSQRRISAISAITRDLLAFKELGEHIPAFENGKRSSMQQTVRDTVESIDETL